MYNIPQAPAVILNSLTKQQKVLVTRWTDGRTDPRNAGHVTDNLCDF